MLPIDTNRSILSRIYDLSPGGFTNPKNIDDLTSTGIPPHPKRQGCGKKDQSDQKEWNTHKGRHNGNGQTCAYETEYCTQ
jgi:hypothetical protein